MLLTALIRICFVILAVSVGLTSGRYFYEPSGFGTWFGGIMGFAIAVTLIAAEVGFRRHFSRSLIAFIIGLAAGLVVSNLLLSVVDRVIQNEDLRNNLDVPLALVTTYLVLVLVLRSADRFRVIIPFVEFQGQSEEGGSAVLDQSALQDGRLPGLLDAGLLPRRLLIPRYIVIQAENLRRSNDAADKLRGKRALATLADLRDAYGERLIIDDTEMPGASAASEHTIGLARLEGARIITTDTHVSNAAKADGLHVTDITLLAKSLAPAARPGEVIEVGIVKAGEGDDQGIGFLDDGTMVVVGNATDQVGNEIEATLLRVHHTSNGRMLFGEIGNEAAATTTSVHRRRHSAI